MITFQLGFKLSGSFTLLSLFSSLSFNFLSITNFLSLCSNIFYTAFSTRFCKKKTQLSLHNSVKKIHLQITSKMMNIFLRKTKVIIFNAKIHQRQLKTKMIKTSKKFLNLNKKTRKTNFLSDWASKKKLLTSLRKKQYKNKKTHTPKVKISIMILPMRSRKRWLQSIMMQNRTTQMTLILTLIFDDLWFGILKIAYFYSHINFIQMATVWANRKQSGLFGNKKICNRVISAINV